MNYEIILIGPPGCGKGTQADLLIDKYSLVDYATGVRLRKLAETDEAIADDLKHGKLVPSILLEQMLGDFMNHEIKNEEHVIFDGSPRKLREKDFLQAIFDQQNRQVKAFYLRLPLETARDRMMERQRSDDENDIIDQRFHMFETETMPVIESYISDGVLVEIDASGSVEQVHADIMSALEG